MKLKVISSYKLNNCNLTKDKIYEVKNTAISRTEGYYGIINDIGEVVVVLSGDVEIIKNKPLSDCENNGCGTW